MTDPKDMIEKVISTVQAAMPENLADDMKSNIQAVLQSSLSELDVVSREELDIQTAVLEKTRAKLEEIERKLVILEEKLNS